MITARFIIGSSIAVFVATLTLDTDRAMQKAADALAMSGVNIRQYSFWDYNPLTLLSTDRLQAMLSDNSGMPKIEPLKFDPFDMRNFDATSPTGIRMETSDPRLGGIEVPYPKR